MAWIYRVSKCFKTMPEQFVDQMTQQMKDLKKESVNCYILGKVSKGYRLSFNPC